MNKLYKITANKNTPFDSLEMAIRIIVENLWGCEAESISEKTDESVAGTKKCYKDGFDVTINSTNHFRLNRIPGVTLTFLAGDQENYVTQEIENIENMIRFHKERISRLTARI